MTESFYELLVVWCMQSKLTGSFGFSANSCPSYKPLTSCSFFFFLIWAKRSLSSVFSEYSSPPCSDFLLSNLGLLEFLHFDMPGPFLVAMLLRLLFCLLTYYKSLKEKGPFYKPLIISTVISYKSNLHYVNKSTGKDWSVENLENTYPLINIQCSPQTKYYLRFGS